MGEMGSDTDYLVIIRASNERTLEVCQKLVEIQAGSENVSTIQFNPFKRALEECFRIAIDSKKKWLITVDADMLVLPHLVETLLAHAEAMPENYLQLQGRIFDKITGTIRKAGPRIYRIKYLAEALQYSLKREDTIRPEGSLIEELGSRGMPSRYISTVVSYHDFEQYYKGLYRKSFVHANKHRELTADLIERCIAHKQYDTDYEVILRGVWDGLNQTGEVFIDTELFKYSSEKALEEMGIVEKDPLVEVADPKSLLQSIQKKNPLDPESLVMINDQPPASKKTFSNLMRILKRDGIVRGSMHGLGIILTKAGNRLQIKS